jgi:arabinose-5-phosphate isomerase
MNESPSVKDNVLFKYVIFSISEGRLFATDVLKDNKKIKVIITDGDIRRLFEKTDNVKHLKASEISKANPRTILNTALAVEALEKMNSNSITQLILLD